MEDWKKVHVVRCGLDHDFKDFTPHDALAAHRLVCVGRLCEEKGHFLLLDALAQLAKRNIAFKMTLVGDGPLRSRITARIEELGLRNNVEITGWVSNSEVRQFLSDARAMILPSFAEGLPVSIMEAFALGRPVISTYFAGIPELVVNGENGWLVPPGDTNRLAGAIEECLSASDARIIAMGACGRMRVLQMHDIAHECAAIASLFRAALNSSGGVEPVRKSPGRRLAAGIQ
jgi:glycosyltransferase involved in cell wall biosynthesis